jgi:hypothetical protein
MRRTRRGGPPEHDIETSTPAASKADPVVVTEIDALMRSPTFSDFLHVIVGTLTVRLI